MKSLLNSFSLRPGPVGQLPERGTTGEVIFLKWGLPLRGLCFHPLIVVGSQMGKVDCRIHERDVLAEYAEPVGVKVLGESNKNPFCIWSILKIEGVQVFSV